MTEFSSPFIDAGIDPLLAEVPEAIEIGLSGPSAPDRPQLHGFIGAIFQRSHGARITAFYPNLIGFRIDGRLRAVVGFRDDRGGAFFSEQYLGQPAHELASQRLGETVERERLVEVGNLAIADPGQARWIISASTAFLAAAGYRWVMFTAIQPLANAFKRLGLKPMALAEADPACLPDRGASWGAYYRDAPQVYLGDIQAGCGKLHGHVARHPNLDRLLDSAHALGLNAHDTFPAGAALLEGRA